MIFHKNRLLADDSNEIPYLNFFLKLVKISQNLSSAAVVIDTLNNENKLNTLLIWLYIVYYALWMQKYFLNK